VKTVKGAKEKARPGMREKKKERRCECNIGVFCRKRTKGGIGWVCRSAQGKREVPGETKRREVHFFDGIRNVKKGLYCA